MGIDINGQDPQGYMGVSPIQNPKTIISTRAPGTLDRRYKIGTPWINKSAGSVYFLTTVDNGAANWAISTPGASDVDTLTGNSGGALSPTAGNMNILGGTNITVAGAGSTLTANLDANPTLAGLLTCNASATILTAGTALTLAADNSADAVILGGGTSARAITIGQDAAAHTIAIGQSAAGAITIDTAAGVSIDAATASNFTVSAAAADLTLASTLGSVLMSSGEDAALAIRLHADAGTSETIQIHSDQGTGVASIDILSDVGGISLTSGLASEDAINLTSSAGGVDIDAALSIVITGTENAADAIQITATAGGIDISASGAAAGEDIDIVATGSSVNLTSTEAVATAIVLNASNAAGGIDLTTGGGSIDLSSAGSVTMVPGTSTAAAATGTVNKNVGVTTHTGLTTASAASQVFTITNSVCTAGSAVFVSASNLGANDAQMTITRVTPGAGSFTVTLTNNGAAALNGDVILTWWIIAA